jgi:hypothetical protein
VVAGSAKTSTVGDPSSPTDAVVVRAGWKVGEIRSKIFTWDTTEPGCKF